MGIEVNNYAWMRLILEAKFGEWIFFLLLWHIFISPSTAFHPSASQTQTQSSMLPIQPLLGPHLVFTVWLPRQSAKLQQ